MDIADTIMQFENNILGKGKTEKEIFEAEKKLGLRFAIDYRQYLKKYGFAIVNGHELTGLSNISCMNVVEATETERSKNYLNEKMKEWYVIENLNIDDVLIWQSSSEEIFQVTPESICKIYDSLSEYIWE